MVAVFGKNVPHEQQKDAVKIMLNCVTEQGVVISNHRVSMVDTNLYGSSLVLFSYDFGERGE